MRFPAGLTARQVAELVGGEFVGATDVQLAGIASLAGAGPGDLVYLRGADGAGRLPHLRAGAVLLERPLRDVSGGPSVRIVVDDAVAAIERLAAAVLPAGATPAIHPTARIGRGAIWVGRLTIGPYAVVGENVRLGRNCTVGTGAVIEDRVTLGDECHIGHHAVVHSDTLLGRAVVIRPGARIGGVGFGFRRAGAGHLRVPHLGRCVIGDEVDVGANSTVDRGVVGDTLVSDGTKIDSLVHVAHNVRIGMRCIIMAQVGIAGSVDVGDDVMLAGQAGLADHLRIGSGARVAAQSGVIGDVPPGATVSGYPARDHRSVLRQVAALGRLTPLVSSIERFVARDE